MARYRRKSLLADAYQWDGSDESAQEIVNWLSTGGAIAILDPVCRVIRLRLWNSFIRPGDWIVCAVEDYAEHCPLHPTWFGCMSTDEFNETYEPVADTLFEPVDEEKRLSDLNQVDGLTVSIDGQQVAPPPPAAAQLKRLEAAMSDLVSAATEAESKTGEAAAAQVLAGRRLEAAVRTIVEYRTLDDPDRRRLHPCCLDANLQPAWYSQQQAALDELVAALAAYDDPEGVGR